MKACPVCSSANADERLGLSGDYTMYRCGACDVVYADPFKAPGAGWYESSEVYSVGRVITKDIEWHHRQVLKMRLPGKRLLDIGCGNGVFISEAKKTGYDAWGLDFDARNIAIAKERYKLENVFCMSVEAALKTLGKNSFDIVTFFEVLEHLDAPEQFLEDIKGLLSDRGVIALSVPNRERALDTLGEGDAPPNHLTKWNAASLKSFLERMGFTVISLIEKPLDHEDLNIYLKGKLRLRIAHNLVKEGLDADDGAAIEKARRLMRIKDAIFGALTYPPGMLLRVFNLKAAGMVCTARFNS
ncbi:MAG: class I SAM-dependent methyltransferase [Deltaproteobacteria bacterium]|nr:class I SAM-dependent methyltransferase [Deltaproteobacteria bacterium]